MALDIELLRGTLRKAEIKRVAENLTKRELCSILELNYNFYNNCVTMRNPPSQQMTDVLHEYLNMPTSEVYAKVFAFRSTDTFIRNKQREKFVKRDGGWKEEFHPKLEISNEAYDAVITNLKRNNILQY